MDADIINSFHSFQLQEEEELGFQLKQSDITFSNEKCRNSLLGKIHRDRVANFTGLKNTLNSIWLTASPFKIQELGGQSVSVCVRQSRRQIEDSSW